MRPRSRVAPRMRAVLLAAAPALLLVACPMRPSDPARDLPGVYSERLPAEDSAGRIVTLWIEPGGTATRETVFVGKGRSPVERGRWTVHDGEVRIVLKPDGGGEEKLFVYAIEGDRLIPRDSDRLLYGDGGLPMRRR